MTSLLGELANARVESDDLATARREIIRLGRELANARLALTRVRNLLEGQSIEYSVAKEIHAVLAAGGIKHGGGE